MTFFSLFELDCFISSLPSGVWLVHEEEEIKSDPSVIYTDHKVDSTCGGARDKDRERDRLALEKTDSCNGEVDRKL